MIGLAAGGLLYISFFHLGWHARLAQRGIVHLAFFYGYTYPEIAAIVGCPVNTVKTRMFYARERLRPVLDLATDSETADERR